MQMKKQMLQTFISKYCLKAHDSKNIESVKWDVKDDVIKVKAMPSDRSVLADIELKSNDISVLNGYTLGIYKTTQLLKLLDVFDEDIDVKLNSINTKAISLELQNESTKIKFALSGIEVIPKTPTKANLPDQYELTFDITSEFTDMFIKCKNSLPADSQFRIYVDAEGCGIVFGDIETNSNNIFFKVPNTKYDSELAMIRFDAFYLKQILSINKNMSGTIKVSKNGILVATFSSDSYLCNYYFPQV